jgi:hypothetical protein
MRLRGSLRPTGYLAAACAASSLTAVAPALAHHSFAMFDRTKSVTLEGTVKDWQFTNPHTWVQIVVMEGGVPVEYGVEGPSVNTLIRVGWSPSTFKPGDKVQIVMNPLRDGAKGGAFVKAILPSGKVLTAGQTPG